jgi:glyceraldehyde-3-phosphate dehydrogenase (ferredoxin)
LTRRGLLDFTEGVRKWSRIHSRAKGQMLHDRLVHVASGGAAGWFPISTGYPGCLRPWPLGKYYMIYSDDFIPPRTLGRMCAERLKKELILDNLGMSISSRLGAKKCCPR